MNSRQKGARGEREFAQYLRDRGYEARRGQQFSGSPDSPDVVCHDLPFHLEVKRVERFNAYSAMEQAATDCGPEQTPMVVHKRNRKEWLVVLRADDFFDLIQDRVQA